MPNLCQDDELVYLSPHLADMFFNLTYKADEYSEEQRREMLKTYTENVINECKYEIRTKVRYNYREYDR
jgi:membrane carboxypeptidase/penicillin-binding protein